MEKASAGGAVARFAGAARLTDAELVRRVDDLVRRERGATVDLVAHLAELEARKLFLAYGYSSLFSYCTRHLRLAEHAAYNRIEAARACRRYPVLLDRLAEGSINLSGLRLLVPHLTQHNCDEVLRQAAWRSKREIELLIASLAPRPDIQASIRRLPTRPVGQRPSPAFSVLSEGRAAADDYQEVQPPAAHAPALSTVPSASVPSPTVPSPTVLPQTVLPQTVLPQTDPSARASNPTAGAVTALSPGRYGVRFTVDQVTHDQLRRAQDLLRREIPDGDCAAIFARALDLLVREVARRKLASVGAPRASRASSVRSRHIPASVKREVWLRDGGQCAFTGRSGRRCRERTFLEFHHLEAYSEGGETSVVNIALRCRAHNVYEFERLREPVDRLGAEDRAHSPRGESRPPRATQDSTPQCVNG